MLPHRNPLLGSAQSITSVTIEYDGRTGRERKTVPFKGSRALYARLLKAGKNPQVIGASRKHP